MNTIYEFTVKSQQEYKIHDTFISTLPQFWSFALLGFTNRKCSLWKLVNHLIWISYQPIRALRPNIGRMHVNVIWTLQALFPLESLLAGYTQGFCCQLLCWRASFWATALLKYNTLGWWQFDHECMQYNNKFSPAPRRRNNTVSFDPILISSGREYYHFWPMVV